MGTDLNKLRDRAYSIAKAHGFHEKEMSDETYLMLIITEISEAVNADRKGKYADIGFETEPVLGWKESFEKYVKDTVEDELADAVIRLLDFAGVKETMIPEVFCSYDITPDNSFVESCYHVVKNLIYYFQQGTGYGYVIGSAIQSVIGIAADQNINLMKFIDLKMKYNELRPYKNGKEY